MPTSRADFFGLLQKLTEHEVDFIVVGGVGAVLHGAPITTFDLDIVHARNAANIGRLLDVLQALDAIYRGQFGRILHPEARALSGIGHHLLQTNLGPLDVLGMVGQNRTYDDLIDHTVPMQLDTGLVVRVLDLDTLIAVKKETARDKDKYPLLILERLKDEFGSETR